MATQGIRMHITGEVNDTMTVDKNLITSNAGKIILEVSFTFIPPSSEQLDVTLMFSLSSPNFEKPASNAERIEYHLVNKTMQYVELKGLMHKGVRYFTFYFSEAKDFNMEIRILNPQNIGTNKETIYFR